MESRFKLTDFFSNDEVLQNCEFSSLGILDSNYEQSMLSFIEEEKYFSKLIDNKNIVAVITVKEMAEKLKKMGYGVVVKEDPRISFFLLHNELSCNNKYARKEYKTIIGNNCSISPLSYVSPVNVFIGDNVIIEEFVSIKENTTIGDNSIIRAGTVVGGNGFEMKKVRDEVFSIKHLGGTKIGKNVEIQYNCTIDRAIYPWDDTVIEEYSRLDNLIHIGHAAKIGRRVIMPAQSVIGGRTIIEDDAWIGIGAVVRNGLKIGKNARCNMGAVVTKNVKNDEAVSGNFAIDHKRFIEKMKKGNRS